MQSRGITAEMALLLACCRWPVAVEAVRDAADDAIDWAQFATLVRRHRVPGLVHNALRTAGVVAPPQTAQALGEDARLLATHNLRLAAESARIVRAVAAAGAPAMIVKGTPLAMLAYGTLALKVAWDIDLLVPPESVIEAADALAAAGYACEIPGPHREALEPWHRFSKESVWRHRDSGIHVELHTALVDTPLVLPGIDARTPGQDVAIAPGIVLPTLGRDALFAYLCVHGWASAWRRAKWLADLGALVARLPAGEIVRLYDRSQHLGAGRAAAQGLLLAHRYLGIALPRTLLERLRGDRITRAATWVAGRMMTRADAFDDPAETATGTLPIHAMQLVLLPGRRFLWSEIRRKSVPDPRLGTGLSRARRWLYPVATFVRRVRRRPLTPG